MKTALFSALIFTLFLSGLSSYEADAQKPKTKHQKIVIKSPGSEQMEFEYLHDTTIISADGKDTTIIKTSGDGPERKVIVHKIITSGSEKDSLHWQNAETGLFGDDDADVVIVNKLKDNGPRHIRIEKRITKGDGSDSIVMKEIRHKEMSGDADIIFDEPRGRKYKTVKVISGDCKDIETEGDGNSTIIYLRDSPGRQHHKGAKGHKKHHKVYIIEEEKTIKK